MVFEVEGESNAFELEVLWKKEEVKEEEEAAAQFVIEDEDEPPAEAPTPAKANVKLLPSLGEKLFSAITDLMFCCGFTLPKNVQVDHHKINYVIWCATSS